jgi:prepilin-type N-terminal cleavage/methylation domain-containing protein
MGHLQIGGSGGGVAHGAPRTLERAAAAPSVPRARPAPSIARGFTLLEVIITLFVIGLAAAVVVPAIGRGTEGLRVRAAVAGVSALLRRAREEAVTTRADLAVVVDPAARVVTEQTADNQVRARYPLPERVTIEAEPPAALTVQFSAQGFSTGGTFRVAAANGTLAYRVTVDPLTGRVLGRREPAR